MQLRAQSSISFRFGEIYLIFEGRASQICRQPLNRQLFGKSLHCLGLLEWTEQFLFLSKTHEPFSLFFKVSPFLFSLRSVYFSMKICGDISSCFAIRSISTSVTTTSPGQLQQFVQRSHLK